VAGSGRDDPNALTPRQHESLVLAAHGLTRRQSARIMGVTDGCVQKLRAQALGVLGAPQGADVRWALIALGWLRPPPHPKLPDPLLSETRSVPGVSDR
jgi:DNA-binding NarL/FixJ family response regulator